MAEESDLGPKDGKTQVACGVPVGIDGVSIAERHVACDASSYTFLREIPQCWMLGPAAGVAAALSANSGVQPKDLDPNCVQGELLRQGAYLSPSVEAGLAVAAE